MAAIHGFQRVRHNSATEHTRSLRSTGLRDQTHFSPGFPSDSLNHRNHFWFLWPKKVFLWVLSSSALHISTKKKKKSYIQYSIKRKEEKKNNRTLLALRINGPNFWSVWPDIQVFCLSCFAPAPVLRCSPMNDAVPGARQGEEKCVTLNSPAGSLTCNFCCSHVVHSWATLGRKKKWK